MAPAVPTAGVLLRSLPAPDALEIAWPEGHVALLVDDGTALMPAVVRRLASLAWPVVVLRPPEQDAAAHTSRQLPSGVPVVQLERWSEPAVVAAREGITERYGPVAACIALIPPMVGVVEDGDSDVLAALAERDLVRLVFLLAKHLHDQLTEAARRSWAGFFAVTRLDGMWGLTGSPRVLSPTSGLAGLTKTLRLEWPAVTCRAVDLAPDLAPDAAAEALIAEMRDPNRAVMDVGWGAEGRMTLEAVAGIVTVQEEEMVDGS